MRNVARTATVAIVILASGGVPRLSAQSAVQTATATPRAFEVASVKVNKSVPLSSGISSATPGRFTVESSPLLFVILYAYQLRGPELIGAPDWASSTLFDITATYPQGSTQTDEEVRAMVQKLLADRFGLTAHRERRQLPIYVLTLARNDGRLGPWMVPSTVDCKASIAEKRPQVGAGGSSPVGPSKQRPACSFIASRRGFLTGGTRTTGELASTIGAMIGDGRLVEDRTGLTGTFDVDLQWAPSSTSTAPSGAAATAQDEGVSIFTAVQEQLGLKLESTRGPVDVLVIDHVEPPTPD